MWVKWFDGGARFDGLWMCGFGRDRSLGAQRWFVGDHHGIRVFGIFDFLRYFQSQRDFQNGCRSSLGQADFPVDSGQSHLFGKFDGSGGFPIFEVGNAAGTTA